MTASWTTETVFALIFESCENHEDHEDYLEQPRNRHVHHKQGNRGTDNHEENREEHVSVQAKRHHQKSQNTEK